MQKKRLLFIQPSQKPVHTDAEKNMFYHLSKEFEGDAICCFVSKDVKVDKEKLNDINNMLPSFNYYVRNRSSLPRILGILSENFFFLRKGIELCRKKKYDAIIAHPIALTGIVGLLLKVMTGVKLVAHVPAHPIIFHTQSGKSLSYMERIKISMIKFLGPIIMSHSDVAKLMYETQLDDLPTFSSKKKVAFFDFIPVRYISSFSVDEVEKYILTVGSQWYIKGMDVLIKAFNQIHKEFPDYKLKIVGRCSTNKDYFTNLVADANSVEFYDYLPNNDVIEIMSKCSIFVNASRTEGVARVIQEAMALQRTVVASNVGGTPTIVNDNNTGLLFESENIPDLEDKLRSLLIDREHARKLAISAQKEVLASYSEDVFVQKYAQMINNI